MKRYWLFGGTSYSASGGMMDFVETFDSVEAAKRFAAEDFPPDDASITNDGHYNWWHIFDTTTMRIVALQQGRSWSNSMKDEGPLKNNIMIL